jgi:hypothetical protein
MFNPTETETYSALLELRDIKANGRPIILWIGAGAGRWAGYPGWEDLANQFHSKFLRLETRYDRIGSAAAIAEKHFPKVFSLCKSANSSRYYTLLSESLALRQASPVYVRMVDALKAMEPLQVITTNIDMSLDKNLDQIPSFDRRSIEFARQEMSQGKSFIYHVHGSCSDITSSIWTVEDYRELIETPSFLSNLGKMLDQASVVFLGYGLRDKYILDLLEENNRNTPLLGSGPHFFVTSDKNIDAPPPGVRVIKYQTSEHVDHRGALNVLDLLRTPVQSEEDKIEVESPTRISAIYIPDYLSTCTFQSSQTFTFEDELRVPVGHASVGMGFIQEELPNLVSTALHDLVVGLMCFDRIYFPIFGIGKLFSDLGEDIFYSLMDSDAFRFVWKTSSLGVVFSKDSVSDGALGCINPRSAAGPENERTLEEILRNQFPAQFDMDKVAKILNLIAPLSRKFGDTILGRHPVLAQGALLSPNLRKCLGISDGVSLIKIPEWLMFPALRVATVVQDAEICRHLGASAAKLPFGSDALADVTYGIGISKFSASHYASYVIAGQFNANLGELVLKNKNLLSNVLKFRDSHAGTLFREEIFELLQSDSGSEFVASVNGRLREAVSPVILDQVRQSFVDTRFAPGCVPVLSHATRDNDPFKLWRKRSLGMLKAICDTRRILPYDLCPCGSGDKLRFCCKASLDS